MLGHIILDPHNKEGWIYVPEVEIRFKACAGERRGWVRLFHTDGMYHDITKRPLKPIMPMAQWVQENFDFVQEIDVPMLMIRLAIEADEKLQKQIKAFAGLLEDTSKEKSALLGLRKGKDFKIIEQAVHRANDIMDSKEPGEITDAKKYAMALQIQRWIHNAGGLC